MLAATPIGNLGDASQRLVAALGAADIVAAEDTRRARDLARGLGATISGRLLSLHEHNERDRCDELVAAAIGGATVLVISDAGMPAISDPGFRLVEAAVAAGVAVTSLPGPSAVLAALAVSGLPTDRFAFEGFLPRKAGERAQRLTRLTAEERTLVFFEAPHRLAATLAAMDAAWGERRASVSRELTKKFEETMRGSLGTLAAWASAGVKGEIVICVEGRAAGAASWDEVVAEARSRVASGERAKDVSRDLAAASGLPQREIYAAVVASKGTDATLA